MTERMQLKRELFCLLCDGNLDTVLSKADSGSPVSNEPYLAMPSLLTCERDTVVVDMRLKFAVRLLGAVGLAHSSVSLLFAREYAGRANYTTFVEVSL